MYSTGLLWITLAAAEPAAHPFFAEGQVQTIRLRFSQPGWYDLLRRNFEGVADPDYAEAAFEWGDVRWERIGVRFKGNSSYRSYPGRKKSLKLKFDKYVKEQEVDGLNGINLNNAFKDPAFVRERGYMEAAALTGLPAPRVAYAAVYINDEYWGLYFLGEEVDKRFLRSRFGEDSGNLYKGDPMGTLEWRGENVNVYKTQYEIETNEKTSDWRDLVSLIDVLNRTPLEELEAKLDPLLDVRAALTWIALDNLTVNLDSYIGSGHNYFLYHRAEDGRFVPIPWDPNEAWGNFSLNMPLDRLLRLPLDFTGAPGPAPPGGIAPPPRRPLVTRLLAVPGYRALYEEIYRKLAQETLSPDVLLGKMTQWRDLIRPYVAEDRQKMFTNEQFEDALTQNIVMGPPGPPPPGAPPPMLLPALDPFLRGRLDFVLATLP